MTDALVTTVRDDDPARDLLAVVAASRTRPVFWMEHPESGRTVAAVGALHEIQHRGAERLARAAADVRRLPSMIGGAAPCLVGGFGFADEAAPGARELAALRFFVPELLWLRERRCTRLYLTASAAGRAAAEERRARLLAAAVPAGVDGATCVAEEIALPEGRERWRQRVERARDLVAAGLLEKVVLARERRLLIRPPLAVAALLARLRAERPACTTFWVGFPGCDFLGSSPELLVRRTGAEVRTGALAGSAPRGRSPDEDRRLGDALRACPKNRHEHALVVAAMHAALAPVTRELTAPAEPRVLQFPEAQHLHTPIHGRVRDPALSVLDLAGRLHPTPAVCGVPVERARALIAQDEPDRGWYAGAVGWLSAAGDGELTVALRAALLAGDTVTLRAGAGIVRGSEPDAEWAETEAKLGALFGAAIRVGNGRAA